jgi:hypothetical protein
MVFRVSRGNVWIQIREAHYELNVQPYNQQLRPANVFLILFQGAQHSLMRAKIRRVCQSFAAKEFLLPKAHNFTKYLA